VVVAVEEAADGALGGGDIGEDAVGVEIPGGEVVGAAVPEGDVGIDGDDGVDFGGEGGDVEGGFGAEGTADEADAAGVDVVAAGEPAGLLADIPDHAGEGGPAAEAGIDFFADAV